MNNLDGIIVNGVKLTDLVMFMEDANRLKTVESDLSKCRASNDSLRERIALLENSLTNAHADRVKAENERDKAREDYRNATLDLHAAESDLGRNLGRAQNLEKERDDARKERDNVLAQVRDSEEAVLHERDRVRLLQSALNDAVERAVAAENALRSLKDDVVIIKNVLDNINTAS